MKNVYVMTRDARPADRLRARLRVVRHRRLRDDDARRAREAHAGRRQRGDPEAPLRRRTCRSSSSRRTPQGLKDKLVSDAPSTIKYDGEKPEALLDEDKVIGAMKLGIKPENVKITPVDEVFAR